MGPAHPPNFSKQMSRNPRICFDGKAHIRILGLKYFLFSKKTITFVPTKIDSPSPLAIGRASTDIFFPTPLPCDYLFAFPAARTHRRQHRLPAEAVRAVSGAADGVVRPPDPPGPWVPPLPARPPPRRQRSVPFPPPSPWAEPHASRASVGRNFLEGADEGALGPHIAAKWRPECDANDQQPQLPNIVSDRFQGMAPVEADCPQ